MIKFLIFFYIIILNGFLLIFLFSVFVGIFVFVVCFVFIVV